MFVEQHAVPGQEETNAESDEEYGAQATEELRLQAAAETEQVQVNLLRVAPVWDASPNLPAAGGEPIDQRRNDDDGERQRQQVGIEWDLKKIERERIPE